MGLELSRLLGCETSKPKGGTAEAEGLPVGAARLGLAREEGDIETEVVRRSRRPVAVPLHGYRPAWCHAADHVSGALLPPSGPDRPTIQRAYTADTATDPVTMLIAEPVLGLHLGTVAVPVHQDDDRLVS